MTKRTIDRCDRAPMGTGRVPHSAGSWAARWARLIVVGAGALGLSACVTVAEQRAIDRGQCDEYGFEPGTDAFARCMMDVSQHREQMQQDRRLALQSQLAIQSQQRAFLKDRDKSLSLQRSGDKRFPVCGAASDGGFDPRAGSWYGPNCRAR